MLLLPHDWTTLCDIYHKWSSHGTLDGFSRYSLFTFIGSELKRYKSCRKSDIFSMQWYLQVNKELNVRKVKICIKYRLVFHNERPSQFPCDRFAQAKNKKKSKLTFECIWYFSVMIYNYILFVKTWMHFKIWMGITYNFPGFGLHSQFSVR